MSATVPAWSGDWGWTDSPPIAGQVLLAGSAAWRLETGTVWDWTPWLSDCASGPVKMRGELPLPAVQRKIEFRSVGRGRLVGFCSSTHNNTMPSALAHCWRLGEGHLRFPGAVVRRVGHTKQSMPCRSGINPCPTLLRISSSWGGLSWAGALPRGVQLQ